MGNLKGIREWQKEEGTERGEVVFMEMAKMSPRNEQLIRDKIMAKEHRKWRSRFYGEGK
jgi:hypothetical protein